MLWKIAYAGILQALGWGKYKTLPAIPWNPIFAHEPEWQDNKCKPWKPSMKIFMTPVFFTHVAAKTFSGREKIFQFLAKKSVKANQNWRRIDSETKKLLIFSIKFNTFKCRRFDHSSINLSTRRGNTPVWKNDVGVLMPYSQGEFGASLNVIWGWY